MADTLDSRRLARVGAGEDRGPAAAARAPQPLRLERGGLIDRAAPLSFTFDGRAMSGYAGDTLASALLANGTGWLLAESVLKTDLVLDRYR